MDVIPNRHATPAADFVLGCFLVIAAGDAIIRGKGAPTADAWLGEWANLYYVLIIVGAVCVFAGDQFDQREWRFFGAFLLAGAFAMLAAAVYIQTGVHFAGWIYLGFSARYASRCFVILRTSKRIRRDRG